MAFTNASANMSLPVPAVGIELGPQYAVDVNNCLTIVDAHDHTPGLGVPITPAGLNINTDLTIQGNNLTVIKTARFSAQNTPLAGSLDLGAVYNVLGDLYYNDGVGNQVRITQNGGVVGTPGSITGMTGGANVAYVSANQTFVFQSAANTPGNIDGASFIFRNLTANSKGLTLNPPSAMGSDFSLTLPNLPASQKFMSLDAAGNMAAVWEVDNSSIVINSNVISASAAALVDGITLESNLNIISVRHGDREHAWELNGRYAGLTYPATEIDSIFFAPYNITITQVWIYSGAAGAAGTTEFDLKVASSGGGFSSIFSTTGKITSAAASGVWTDAGSIIGAQTGVTKPVLSTIAVTAGQAIRFDLITGMTTTATDARIRIFYKQS